MPQPSPANIPSSPEGKKISTKTPKAVFFIFPVLILAGGIFSIVRSGILNKLMVYIPHVSPAGQTAEPKREVQKKTLQLSAKVLSDEEKKQLTKRFQITIPRQLSEDEESILKKRASFPAKFGEKPKLVAWKKEDLEKMIKNEQKKRGIQLGWSYVKGILNAFEKNYPEAIKAAEGGNYELTRNHFIESLAFPIYRNNRQLHRAVALVILRPYINDVIGKIAVVNQYLIVEQYSGEAKSVFEQYQALFPVLELQEWEKALGLIGQIKERTKALENMPKDAPVAYPPSFAKLDQEVQQAVLSEAAPKPEGAVNLKALMVDLDLKERTVQFNTSEELTKIQKKYDEGVQFIEEGKWGEVGNALSGIDFPPELVDDVKSKLEQIDKVLAVQTQKQDKTSK